MRDVLSRVVSILLIVLLLGVGWIRIRRRLASYAERQAFVQEFLQKLQTFINSQGSDTIAYSWLTQRSARMQEELGLYGFLQAYHRPFQNLVYNNTPVIFTLLPELYSELNRGGLTGGYAPAIAQYQQTLQEVLVRHLGILEDGRQSLRSELQNPFVWFREGARSVVFLPVTLLGWLGVASALLVRRITASTLARLASSILTLLALCRRLSPFSSAGSSSLRSFRHSSVKLASNQGIQATASSRA